MKRYQEEDELKGLQVLTANALIQALISTQQDILSNHPHRMMQPSQNNTKKLKEVEELGLTVENKYICYYYNSHVLRIV